jgi:hypothetical protein
MFKFSNNVRHRHNATTPIDIGSVFETIPTGILTVQGAVGVTILTKHHLPLKMK